jgi:hypothetical protein
MYFGQNLTITVKEYSSKAPIKGAMLASNKQVLGYTNENGTLSFVNQHKPIKVIALGFDTTEIILGNMNQTVYLSKMELRLKEVKIKPVEDVFANAVIRSMIRNFPKIHPDQSPSYKYDIYSKIVIDANEDSLKKQDNKGSDTEVLKFIKLSKIFVWEKLTEAKHDIRYGEKKTVLTSNMAGFKQPIYELIAMSLDKVNYLPWIFRDDRYKEYIFRFEDSSIIKGRKTYEINFFPKKKFKSTRSRSGFVHVDSTLSAMIKYYGHTAEGYAEIEDTLINNYCFTKSIYFKATRGNFSFNGINPIVENTIRVKNFIAPIALKSIEFKGNETDISISLNDKHSFELLNRARGLDTMDSREANTYHTLDSIIRREQIDKKIKLFLALAKGAVKLGHYNISINDLLQYNGYEGFRMTLAAETNYEFNRKIYLNGYVGYGFGDKAFKFGGGARYLIHYYNQMQLIVQYQNDVTPIGRVKNELTNPIEKQNYLAHLMFFENYMGVEKILIGFQHDVHRHVTQKSFIEIEQINPLTNYTFQNISLHNLTSVNVGLKVHYYPGTHYVSTSEGKFPSTSKPTHLFFQYSFHYPTNKNISSFHTAELEAKSKIKSKIGMSSFVFYTGWCTNNTPLISLFEGLGGSPTNTNLYSSFGLGSYRHFVTMQPSTFYSNYYTSLFLTQIIPPIRLSEKTNIHAAFCYKAILGGLSNTTDHSIALIAPSKLYQEAGLEVNRIFTQLGIGIFYRFGAYQQDGFQNNLAGRLLINF